MTCGETEDEEEEVGDEVEGEGGGEGVDGGGVKVDNGEDGGRSLFTMGGTGSSFERLRVCG